jgi:hypothetical protein
MATLPVSSDGPLLVEMLQEQAKGHQAQERELRVEMEKLRAEAVDAKLQAADAKLQALMQVQALELQVHKLTPAEAISEPQLTALQARFEALHAAQLLSDDEVGSLYDVVGDYLEYKGSMGVGIVITVEQIRDNENASKLLRLISMSEGIVADVAFARLLRRKYV